MWGRKERDAERNIAEQVRRDVRGGYVDAVDIVDMAIDLAEDELPERRARKVAEKALAQAIAELQREQAAWSPLTDYDRLEAAFLQLEAVGIVARENFACCGNCGVAEIGAEMDDAAAVGRPVRGYVFFHQQDTERAVDGEGLYLNYGAAEEGDAAAVAVGREVAAQMAAAGLTTHWNGDIGQRIGVDIVWRRRWRAS